MNLKQYINKFAPEIWEYKDSDFSESFISLTLDYLGSFEKFKMEDVELLNKYGYDDIDFIEEYINNID